MSTITVCRFLSALCLLAFVSTAAAQSSGAGHGIDYDRDGIDDQVIYRPSAGLWAIKSSSDPSTALWRQWGLPNDHPLAGDYTGDGIGDLVVWRPSNGNWYVCKSDTNFDCFADGGNTVVQFGLPGDRPIKADYDGDGTLDVAVWRPASGLFIWRSSATGQVAVTQWGLPTDIPIPTATDR